MTTHLIDQAGSVARVSQQGRRAKVPGEARSKRESRREQRLPANVDHVLDDSFPASDPPSWTTSISRVASSPERQPSSERLVRLIRAEYLEMPGLCLTIEQAQRLWSLEAHTCEALLNSLINLRFLRRTDSGQFVLRRPRG